MVIFNDRIGDVAERYLRKGRKVYIEGSLQTRKWTDQGGQERYTTEVVLSQFRGELVLIDSQRGEEGGMAEGGSGGGGYRERTPAQRPAATGGAQRGSEVAAADRHGKRRRAATWTTKSRSERHRLARLPRHGVRRRPRHGPRRRPRHG